MNGGRRRSSGGTVVFLLGFGLVFVLLALWPAFRAKLDSGFGFERALALAVGFLFIYLAAMVAERNRFQVEIRDLLEQLLEGVYGKNYRQVREAIDILVRTLSSADSAARKVAVEQLRRLTGQDFGEDSAQWARWWEAHRRSFRASS